MIEFSGETLAEVSELLDLLRNQRLWVREGAWSNSWGPSYLTVRGGILGFVKGGLLLAKADVFVHQDKKIGDLGSVEKSKSLGSGGSTAG